MVNRHINKIVKFLYKFNFKVDNLYSYPKIILMSNFPILAKLLRKKEIRFCRFWAREEYVFNFSLDKGFKILNKNKLEKLINMIF